MINPRRASAGQASTQRPVMGPPETPGPQARMMQASPNIFPTLQFSPDTLSNSPYGPATAPVYPQSRLFWDPSYHNTTGMDAGAGLQPYQDPFAISQNQFNHSLVLNSNVVPGYNTSPSFSQPHSYDLPAMSTSMNTSYVDGAAFPAPFTTSPRMPPPRDDNPSMFLSSPARRFGHGEQGQIQPQHRLVREKPAYHHQIEESRREKEAKRAKKTDVRHPSVTRSVMEALRRPVSPVKDSRPGLKRSLTHSGVGSRPLHLRQQSHVSFLDTASTTSNSTTRSRNGGSSPLRNMSDAVNRQTNTSRNSKRTSLSLTIDENGVAKTIVTKAAEVDEMDLDESTSESENSSRDDDDFHILRSQPNSFAFPEEEEEEVQPTHIAPSRLQGHSKSSSYSTMTSNSSARHSSRTGSFHSRGGVSARGHIQRKSGTLETMQETASTGDAQHALKAILQDRSRSTSAHDGSVSSRHSMQFNSSPPIHHNQFSNMNASPTTITDPDLATPSTDRGSSLSVGSTRCVCNSNTPESASLMIQCDSCSKWLHAHCVGVDSRRLPDVYVCVYCIQTPVQNGGVVDPRRSTAVLAGSPLAHKSRRGR